MTGQDTGQRLPLDLIVVEDSPIDIELVTDSLRDAGLAASVRRVEDEHAFRAALDDRLPDAILSDWTLPHFSGRGALAIASERCPEVPFIFVSGTISESSALEALRQGAVDYVYKHQLQRLGPVLIRALEEARALRLRQERESQIAILNITLRTLSACNSALIHAQTEEELFQNVCRNIVEIGGYPLVWVSYPGEGQGEPRFGARFGDEAMHQRHAELALRPGHASHCLSVAALRTRQTQVCNNLHEKLECDSGPLREVGVEAILALPLLQNDVAHGVLTIFSSTPDVFDADEIKLMEELAADLAYGIATLRTHIQRDQALEGERNQAVMLRQALEQTIAAIALTLEKRDPYTAGHQERVAGIAAAIATEIGLSPQQVEGIHFGSLIHDIGKVYVPAEILNRPGKLTELEFGLIKTHPEVGFDIVKNIPFPWPVAQMVHQHHERLDGSGYPQGLKGEEIMLEARILAVADVLEAMAAHRPYRAALGLDAAMKELERGRGTAFDAAVVDACLRLVKEKGFIFARP